jgi:hypothetical protein
VRLGSHHMEESRALMSAGQAVAQPLRRAREREDMRKAMVTRRAALEAIADELRQREATLQRR